MKLSWALTALLMVSGGAPARAETPDALTIVGFSRNSKQVLYHARRGDPAALLLYDRDGKALEPPRSTAGLEKTHRFGARLRRGALQLDESRQRLHLRAGGQSILVWSGKSEGGACAVREVLQGKRSRDRLTLALVIRKDTSCAAAPETLILSLRAVARRYVRESAALIKRSRLKQASAALATAQLLLPRSVDVLYKRACAAALASDQRRAVKLLRKLKTRRAGGARRLFVKSKFDSCFRLIRNSSAFKDLFQF